MSNDRFTIAKGLLDAGIISNEMAAAMVSAAPTVASQKSIYELVYEKLNDIALAEGNSRLGDVEELRVSQDDWDAAGRTGHTVVRIYSQGYDIPVVPSTVAKQTVGVKWKPTTASAHRFYYSKDPALLWFSVPESAAKTHCLSHSWVDTGGLLKSFCKHCDAVGVWDREQLNYVAR